MLKIKRVLGSQKSFELLDGRIVPFAELAKLQEQEITGVKKKVAKKRTRRRKVKTDEPGS
jgi:hypothetical protein